MNTMSFHLGAVKPGTPMIRVKIELLDTNIRRTIVVPSNLTLENFAYVIQVAVGWDGSHPWEFYQGKDLVWNCDVFEDESYDPADYPWMHARKNLAPSLHTIAEVFAARGRRLYFTYDFGDSWQHVIYRMGDPKEGAMPCCEKTSGTWSVDDIGGPWALMGIIESLQKWEKDCTDAECREGELSGDMRFWYGWGKKAVREAFLAGPTTDEVTAKLSQMFRDPETSQ